MSPIRQITIVPASVDYAESFRQCIDSVARERRWLASVEGFPIEKTRAFLEENTAAGNPAFFALEGDRVVGWADIRRKSQPVGWSHAGELGIGVLGDYRGQGIGRQLMQAVVDRARTAGLLRVELTVYASNETAIALYRNFGFVEEGRKVKGRYLDGRFDDILMMARLFEENLLPERPSPPAD